MPVTVTRKTPGVYIEEVAAFPPSVVGVETAVPAFIGYTQRAERSGKPWFNKPVKIRSMAEYIEIFGGPYKPIYDIEDADVQTDPNAYDFKVYDPENKEEKYYDLVQTEASEFYLYYSLKFFYANGGGTCYVVSVGTYEQGTKIEKDALIGGLDAIAEQVGPTMLVVPDATLLPGSDDEKPWVSTDYREVVQAMLGQCAELQDRVAILDVYGSLDTTKSNLDDVIARFRDDVGDDYLSYGMGYFPFLNTTVFSLDEVDYTNINIEESAQEQLLKDILSWQNLSLNGDPDRASGLTGRGEAIEVDIKKISPSNTEQQVTTLNNNLSAALPILVDIEKIIVGFNDQLPPSGAMAGIFTKVDNNRGVWNAPANVVMSSVVSPTFKVDDKQQGDLNVPVNGKAVDVLREFVGRGTVVWGARTLDGNSPDYRYIQVRRTLIYIEQSIKAALDPFVFAANDGKTWVTVTSLISNFLQGVWNQGGLMGATASEAYSVECGLGSTMTSQDILDGYMIVQVTLQMIRPAEFIVLTFKQKMGDS